MREKKTFGKRQENKRELPNDKKLKETFAIVNKGCDSEQVVEFIKRTTGHEIKSKVTPKREISKQYMPKNKEKVLLKFHFSGDDEIHISDGYYDAYDFEFHIANNPKYRIVCVIAWKELPKESD